MTNGGCRAPRGISIGEKARSATAICHWTFVTALEDRAALLDHRGGRLDGLHAVVVAGAPAEVPRDPHADLVLRGVRVGAQEIQGPDEHAGRAEPALEPVVLPEGLLE